VIALDGPGGAGKSTLARRVAEATGFVYLDTGAMYRAVAYAALQAGLGADPAQLDEGAVASLAEAADLRLVPAPGCWRVLLRGEDVTEALRAPAVEQLVPHVAGLPAVRRALVPLQRRLAAEGGVVVDGRDVGTAVLPDAEYKFFVTADLRVRARRRQRDLALRGETVAVEDVERRLAARDALDSERGVGPLRQAADALLLDTTELTVEQAVRAVLGACPDLGAPVGSGGADGGGPGR